MRNGRFKSDDKSGASEGELRVPDVLPSKQMPSGGGATEHRALSSAPGSNMTVRLANGSESDYRAGVFLAREAHRNTIFRDIPFSEDKAQLVFERMTS
ncbi:hypothetical protein [Labrenzia sp. THAF82]|uniref:hypothetical protein n=1 Tax=Labrenzia sp. THAF82 TaxID=2587861 RepID=UPI0012687495|nr:hypothetical protein [Labrenzia sp. THAF82]